MEVFNVLRQSAIIMPKRLSLSSALNILLNLNIIPLIIKGFKQTFFLTLAKTLNKS
ncbi:hypothetical protein D3C72_679130 [compost metagenome]